MPYLISALAAVTGVVVLLTVLMRLRGRARLLADTVGGVRAHFARDTGMLAARIAALRVALKQRRRNGGGARSAQAA